MGAFLLTDAVTCREQLAQLGIGHGIERGLPFKTVANMFDNQQERNNHHKPKQPYGKHDDLLAGTQERHGRGEHDRHADSEDDGITLEPGVQPEEARRMLVKISAELPMVGHGADDLRRAITAFGQVHRLVIDYVGFGKLLREHEVGIGGTA